MTSVAKDGPETIARLVGFQADVAQLVEHHLAKVRVAGSNPVVRSRRSVCPCGMPFVAEWPSGLGKGLQSPVHGFDSRLHLQFFDRARLAQRESASLTRKRSLVQSQYRPLIPTPWHSAEYQGV